MIGQLGHKRWSDYATQDVKVTQKLIKLIEQEEPSEEATNLSHDLALVCRDISNNGWKFDLDKAYKLLATLTEKRENIRSELDTLFEDWYEYLRGTNT